MGEELKRSEYFLNFHFNRTSSSRKTPLHTKVVVQRFNEKHHFLRLLKGLCPLYFMQVNLTPLIELYTLIVY